MTHRLTDTARSLAFAAAGTAVVAVADLLDRQGATTATLLTAVALLVGAFLLARTRNVALTVADGQVIVSGLLTTRTFDAHEVTGVTATSWNSFIELADGSSVMTLLRADDLHGLELAKVAPAPAAPVVRELVTA